MSVVLAVSKEIENTLRVLMKAREALNRAQTPEEVKRLLNGSRGLVAVAKVYDAATAIRRDLIRFQRDCYRKLRDLGEETRFGSIIDLSDEELDALILSHQGAWTISSLDIKREAVRSGAFRKIRIIEEARTARDIGGILDRLEAQAVPFEQHDIVSAVLSQYPAPLRHEFKELVTAAVKYRADADRDVEIAGIYGLPRFLSFWRDGHKREWSKIAISYATIENVRAAVELRRKNIATVNESLKRLESLLAKMEAGGIERVVDLLAETTA